MNEWEYICWRKGRRIYRLSFVGKYKRHFIILGQQQHPNYYQNRYSVSTIKTKTKKSIDHNSSYYSHKPTDGVNMHSQIFVAITLQTQKGKQ
jgi:hypothetical protein